MRPGTTTVWDDDHLVFADIHSPGTTNNLLLNPAIEINMVDIFRRKGYRFKGMAKVLSEGSLFEEIISFYRDTGSKHTNLQFSIFAFSCPNKVQVYYFIV